jgi:hypothetical protein
MSELDRISGAAFREKLKDRPLTDIDKREKPKLYWIAIASLRVDRRYQRRIIGRASEKNVISIAENFSWSKFAPVVVAEVEEGIFAIIDGQHRTTAAALRGIRDVPCLIHIADMAEQASAFAAINGAVTAMSTMQLFHARLAAGDPASVELRDACAEASVTICQYPIPASQMKAGDTLAASKLAQQLIRYGRATFIAALKCITQTADGNIGFVRAPVVEALCAVLNGEPAWQDDMDALLAAMEQFDFKANYAAANVTSASDRVGLSTCLVEVICAHLESTLGVDG